MPQHENFREALDLYSLRHLIVILGVSKEEVFDLTLRAGGFYQPFPKRTKPKPFPRKPKPQKNRLIDNPTGFLKQMQSRIEERLLKRLLLPEHLLGGIPGKTIRQNAALHFGAPCVATIDIKNFFPSITPWQVHSVWKNLLNCSPQIADILTKLTTFRGRLPQGAPTSTLLANLVLASNDVEIRAVCQAHEVVYSSWVDDLAFSGEKARDIISSAIQALRDSGFSVSHRKIRVMGKGEKKTINNLVLGKFITVEKAYRKQIRAGIHNLACGKVVASELVRYLMSLDGQINYVGLFDAKKAARLRTDLAAAKMKWRELHRNARIHSGS